MPAQPMAMVAADDTAPDPQVLPDGPLRRCLATRAVQPKSALLRCTSFTRFCGFAGPQSALMLMPFGSSPIAMTSAPSSWNTGGAM